MSFVDVAVAHRELPTFSAALEKGLAAPLSAYEKTHTVAWSLSPTKPSMRRGYGSGVSMGVGSPRRRSMMQKQQDDSTDRNIDQLVETATQSMEDVFDNSATKHGMSVSLPPVDAREKQQARHQDAASTPRQDVDGQSGEEMRASSPVDVRTTSPDLSTRRGSERSTQPLEARAGRRASELAARRLSTGGSSPRRASTNGAAGLGPLLENAVPFDIVFEDEKMTLAESGEGQEKLRTGISKNLKRVIDVFRDLDEDGSGEVDRREFRKGIRLILGDGYSNEEVDELFDEVDSSGDGRISYRELNTTLTKPPPPSGPLSTGAKGGKGRKSRSMSMMIQGLQMAASGDTGAGLHSLRIKEVERLFAEFKQQHADGVCKIDRFDTLLRMMYPTETKPGIAAMMACAAAVDAAEAFAEQERIQRELDIETIFNALDLEGGGGISQAEFLSLRDTACTTMSHQELRQIFREKDLDSSGTIDLDEFRKLCADFPALIEYKEAICKNSDALKKDKKEQREAAGEVEEVWKLGLPKKLVAARERNGAGLDMLRKRPSLVDVAGALRTRNPFGARGEFA